MSIIAAPLLFKLYERKKTHEKKSEKLLLGHPSFIHLPGQGLLLQIKRNYNFNTLDMACILVLQKTNEPNRNLSYTLMQEVKYQVAEG